MISGVIYMYTSPSNKVYIGQTIDENKRKASHKSKAKKFEEAAFSRAIKKYGFENFRYEVLHISYGETKEEVKDLLNFWERFYISEYKSNNSKFGYNLNIGGGSNVGYKHSDATKELLRKTKLGENNPNYGKCASLETRLKMSEAHKNFHHTEETKRKLSTMRIGEKNPMFGRKLSEETIAKISGQNNHGYGKHLSEETRKKIGQSNKGKIRNDEVKKHISDGHKKRDKDSYNPCALLATAIWILPDGSERIMKVCHVKRFHKDWIMKEKIDNINKPIQAHEQPHREE